MKRHRKLIVAGVLAAALAGGAGVAMASDGGGQGGTGDAKETESYSVPHEPGNGPEEKGLTESTTDNGEPGHTQAGTAPDHAGEPDTHSYSTR
ncbi:hypothetical protein [Streptomyces sp. B6B3]|uniref:hypothetical protein n=1 Tax=Streptomyces sp. B6B3 TaxID=3153570 RepID=UPI00325C77CB